MPTTTNFGWTYPTPLDPATQDLWGATLNTLFQDVDDEMATRTAAYDFADNDLERAVLVDTGEKLNALGNQSGAVAIDYTDGHYVTLTATGNISGITISNWPASGTPGWMTIEITQDGTGSRTLTLGAAYKTAGGAGVTLSTAAASVDTLHLFTRDGGTTIYVIANLDWS